MVSLQAGLDPRHYHDAAILARERTDILGRTWIFACLADDVPSPDDYFIAQVGVQEVIVRRGKSGLKAFVNICSHRHSRIHDQPRGHGRLVCPYHGWSYDDDGVPVGIPLSENFPQVCADRRSFALQQPELESVGKFVFVRLQPGGPRLREFLGEAWDFLSNVSGGIGVCLDEFHGNFDANWKIVVENAVESYHVPIVHPGTFVTSSQFSTKDEDVSDQQFAAAGHSQRVAMADPDWLRRWTAFAATLGRWPLEFDRYTHQSVFPNFTVTSFMGYLFHLQSYFPGSPDSTRLYSRIFSANVEGLSEEGAGVMRAIHEEALKFTRKVIDEDRGACARVHEGSRFASRKALLGLDVEKRVRHFQNAYLQALDRRPELP